MSTAAAEIAARRTFASAQADSYTAVDESSTAPLDRRWFAGAAVLVFILAFAQAPGQIVADTKYDLTQNPLGFLARASHQWTSQAPLGQVQNQAYGYFFPHGAFFSLGDVLGLPPWITQRIWWALLILAGFWGIVRLAETLGIGSRSSRIIAGIAFALSPRVLTTLGSISSETLPMMLAPWVVLAPAALVSAESRRSVTLRSPARLAAQSGLAVALMGSVNAVATVAACLVAVLWWASNRPNRRWWVFTAWWIPCLLLATFWWLVPLLLLGRVSPPFLDYIESAGVTTQWTSLAEVLRGTDSWTPFVSPERIAGAVLVTQPAAVIATGLVAAAGLTGLAMRSMPAKGRLVLILFVGLAGLCAGYVGELGSPFADSVRLFLDSDGAPLRNVHKLEPLIRLPLVLGLAHLLAHVPLPGSAPLQRWRSAFAHPERDPIVALTSLILVALTLATSLAWTGKLAPRGEYPEVPQYWHDAADWLDTHAGTGADAQRALVIPGAPFASQMWGLTRDEPLQALASTPWAVRDAVPLNPPGAIRAMDSIQRLIADGEPSNGMAATLLGQGIGYLVLRNDLDPDTSRSTRPVLVHQSIEGSPGLTKVAEFGEYIGPGKAEGLVADGDLRPDYPAIEIYRVTASGAPPGAGPYTVDLDTVPIVVGGPESLQRRNEQAGRPSGPVLLAGDAALAGLPISEVAVADTPTDRETDFGQVDNHSSAIRAPTDPRRTLNLVPDYPVYGADLVRGQWSGASITVSSSASDATQLGGVAPGSGPAATVDGDPATSWVSNGLESALGQWLQLDLDRPINGGLLHLTTSPAAIGTPVKWIEISTPNGTTGARVTKPGTPLTISLPAGKTPRLRITATRTEDGSVGSQFGISELGVQDFSNPDAPIPLDIRHRTVLPQTPAGAAVSEWDLGQELPGRTGCVDGPVRVRCSKGLALAPEELATFQRTLSVPANTAVVPQLMVRSRQGPGLETLLTEPNRTVARGQSDIGDARGSAFAATDGDPRTSWTAPEDTVRAIGGAKPTLTIELPQPVLVTGLAITPSLGNLPAAPTAVSVNLGDGPQVRDLPEASRGQPQRIDLAPQVTNRIELSLVSWKEILDQTALGFAQVQPAGLAEVTVQGADGQPIASPTADPDRSITVGCGEGPVVSIAGQRFQTSVTATVTQLRAGTPVPARVCNANGPVPLPRGSQDVDVIPGPLFFTDALRLDAAPESPGPESPPQSRSTSAWTENHREIHMIAAPIDQLLVVPQSNNIGWEATTADGHRLRPVVVNGWQQGWIVPAGTNGGGNNGGDTNGGDTNYGATNYTVTLSFPSDRWYRLGIFGGLLLLLPLLALALLPVQRASDEGPAPRQWRSRLVGFGGLLALTLLIAGPTGPILTVVLAAGALWIARTKNCDKAIRVLVGITGVSAVLSAAVLSKGPWRSPDGYIGHSLWVQLPALIAVIAVGLSALPRPAVSPELDPPRSARPVPDPPCSARPVLDPPRSARPVLDPPRSARPVLDPPMLRRLSHRFTARRTGSSTKA